MPLLETISSLGALATSPFNYAVQNAQLNKQRKWAVEDRDYQNKYNSPRAQVARNRAAGLPLAALFSGAGAGGQSDQPRGTTIQPELKAEKSIENFNMTRMNNAQLELIRENTRQAKAEADLKTAERDVLLRPYANEGDVGYLNPKNWFQGYSNLEYNLRTKQNYETSKNELQIIEKGLESDKAYIQNQLKEKGITVDLYESMKNKYLKDIEVLGEDLKNREALRKWKEQNWDKINQMDDGPMKFISGMLMRLFDGYIERGK